jgi:hypothetical protein
MCTRQATPVARVARGWWWAAEIEDQPPCCGAGTGVLLEHLPHKFVEEPRLGGELRVSAMSPLK